MLLNENIYLEIYIYIYYPEWICVKRFYEVTNIFNVLSNENMKVFVSK